MTIKILRPLAAMIAPALLGLSLAPGVAAAMSPQDCVPAIPSACTV